MSETTQPTPASTENPPAGSEQGSAPAGAEGSGVPEGFVPVAELERERQRAREFQGRYDRLAAEMQAGAGRGGQEQSGAAGEGAEGFDPDAFRQALLRDVYGATQLAQTVQQLRSEFPHADPALLTPERLSQFGSPEALRFAVEDSHRRVTDILATERAALEQKIREELAAAAGGSGGPAGGTTPPAGDPTPEQLAAMSADEFMRVPQEVLDRVMGR